MENKRPDLDMNISEDTFRNYYYLKEELVEFCKKYNLPNSGSKIELTDRIAYYLSTGKIKDDNKKKNVSNNVLDIDDDTIIEKDIVCSQIHREYFKSRIGKSFSFNVKFQEWLKSNSGKRYSDALVAYKQILEDKKKNKTEIDRQFEYNTYIRDFFNDNKGKSLEDAITCWKYKKSLKGHNKYEKEDLVALG